MTEDEDAALERRIREKARRLWEAEGRPHGREESFRDQAKEMVAIEDAHETALKPIPEAGEPVEPEIAVENQGEFPDLTDQGEQIAEPSIDVAVEHADDRPEGAPTGDRSMPRGRPDAERTAADAAGQFAGSRGDRANPVVLSSDGDASRKDGRHGRDRTDRG